MASGSAERALGGPPPTTQFSAGEATKRRQIDAHRRERTRRIARALHPVVILAGLAPAAIIIYQIFYGGLGANPIEEIQHRTGDWTLNFLAATLTITPLRRLTSWGWLQPYRRTLGLLAFFYATTHLLNYMVLDLFFDWGEIGEDILERPYITIGMAAFVALIPLALTSTKASIKRLGGKRWTRLHQLIYPIVIMGTVHYWMSVKKDIAKPLTYAIIFGALLAIRIAFWSWDRMKSRPIAL
jgi:sulfoxide reductase heme-binding subunit YedZ